MAETKETTLEITATVEPEGKKFRYTIYVDGVKDERRSGMLSKVRYEFINVQRWSPVGVEKIVTEPRGWLAEDGSQNSEYDHTPVSRDYGAPDEWAARYSRKPKPLGAKIEYGFCAENVKITEVQA